MMRTSASLVQYDRQPQRCARLPSGHGSRSVTMDSLRVGVEDYREDGRGAVHRYTLLTPDGPRVSLRGRMEMRESPVSRGHCLAPTAAAQIIGDCCETMLERPERRR